MALLDVPGTDLDEIREEEERFAALVERELRRTANAAVEGIGAVTIVAQGVAAMAASPDDLNSIPVVWRERLSTSIMPALRRVISAASSAQIAGLNAALGTPVIAAFDEQLVTQLLLEGAESRLVGVGNELWENARTALASGVAEGQSIPDVARAVREQASVTAPRATAIARTEVIGASNKSSVEVMRASGLVAQKRWIATFDARVRLSHIEAHGQIVPLDGTFTVGGAELDHPGDFGGPADEVINCVAASSVVDAPIIKMAMRSWFNGEMIEFRTATGHTLTVTPKHPVLTARGWIAAESLVVGDDVVSGNIRDRVRWAQNNVHRRPPSIGKIYDATALSGIPYHRKGMADFHGERRETKVYIVPEYRELTFKPETSVVQELHKLEFAATDLSRLRESGRFHRTYSLGVSGSIDDNRFTPGGVCLACELPTVSESGVTHPQFHDLVTGTNRNLTLSEYASYCSSIHTQLLAQGNHSFSLQVALDNVVSVYRRSFHGYVYNLETTGGWYTCNSIITKNCRCALGYAVDEDVNEEALIASTQHNHNGAMIALVPTEEDQKRLTLDEGEPIDELHMTMLYLGDASEWSAEQREAVINRLSTYDWDYSPNTGALACKAFGLAHWNPHGDTPCWVLNISGDTIHDVKSTIELQLAGLRGETKLPEIPAQHRSFAAHLCLAYTSDTSPELIEQLKERMGDVAFDRVRVAFAGESIDISLRGTMSTKASAAPAVSEATVDWFIEKNHEECTEERPWAVVKVTDGSVEGCHETNQDAVAQLRALLEAQARERDDELEKELAEIQAATEATVDSQVFQDDCPPGKHRDDQGNCVWIAGLAFVEGVAVIEGEWTGDGRQFAPDSLAWENLDEVIVPLQWQKETNHGGITDTTVNVGRLTGMERSGSEIRVSGYIDTGSEDGAEVVRRLRTGTLGGVSIVADDPEQADVEFVFPEGCDDLDDLTPEEIDQDVPIEDIERCLFPSGMIFHSGRIRALTLVDTPAFVEASIHLVESESAEDTEGGEPVVISEEFGTVNTGDIKQLSKLDMNDVQSVAQFIDEIEELIAASYAITIPDVPPTEWFSEPTELPPFGALTVTDEGRVYGLLAPRDVAHRSFQDKRVTVPMGNVDYSRWMNRETIVQGGQRVATGPITMECGHATTSERLTSQGAMDHYDNACSVVATARVGESKHGVWIAGALLPGVTPAQVARMLACAISGDWRSHREKPGMRELAGALLVPVPGFPVTGRANLRLEQGELVASSVPVTWKISGDVPDESKVDEDAEVKALVATVIGSTDLPIADRDMAWDGAAARNRVFDMCTSGDAVDTDCVARAFLFRDPDQDAENRGAYSLGFADVVDGRLQIVPRGVAATAGGRGVGAADIPEPEKDTIRGRICTLYGRIRDQFEDWPECPFERDDGASSDVEQFNDEYADGSEFGEWVHKLRTQSGVDSSEFEVDDFPSWEEIQRRHELRAQTREIAERLQRELGIEIGV